MRNFNRLKSIIYTCALTCLCWGAIVNGLSDKRLCADPKCEKPISQATALLNYPAGDEGLISLKINSNVRVMSKSAGRDKNLWGVEVNGRRGYVPQNVIREFKILVPPKDLKYEVPVNETPERELPSASVPVLNASEGGGVKIELETTTTTPLDVQLNVDASILMGKDNKEHIKTPTPVASPVQEKMEIIDGTQLPVTEINSESINEAIKAESQGSDVKEVETESKIPVSPQLSPEKTDAIKDDIQFPVVNKVDTEKQFSPVQVSPKKNDAIKAEIKPPVLEEERIPVSENLFSTINSVENAIITESVKGVKTELHIPESEPQVPKEVDTEEQTSISAELSPKKNDALETEIQSPIVKEVNIEEQIPVSAQLPFKIKSVENAITAESQDHVLDGVQPEPHIPETESPIPKKVNTEEQIPISAQLSPEKIDTLKTENQPPVVKEVNIEERIPVSAQLPSKIKSVENEIINESQDHVNEVKTVPHTTESEPPVPKEVNKEEQIPISAQSSPGKYDTLKTEIQPPVVKEVNIEEQSREYAKDESLLFPNESIKGEGHIPITELKGDSISQNSNSESIEKKYDYRDYHDDDKIANKTNDIPTGPLLIPKNETEHSKDLKISLSETSSQEVKVSEVVKETTVKTEVVTEATETKDVKYIDEQKNNKKHKQAEQNENTKDKETIQEVENQEHINTKNFISSTVASLLNETETKYVNSEFSTENVQADQDAKIKEEETIQAFENQQPQLPNESEIKNIESTTQFTPIQENILVNVERTVTEPGFYYEPNDVDFDVTTTSAPKTKKIENEIPTVPSVTTLPIFQTPVLQQHAKDKAAQEQRVEVQNNERYKTEEVPNRNEKYAGGNVNPAEITDNKNIEHQEHINPNDYYQQHNEQDILNSKIHDATEHHRNSNLQQNSQQQEPETTYTTEGTTNLHEHDNLQAANSIDYNSPEFLTQNQVSSKPNTEHTTPIALPSTLPPETEVTKKENDLFATILGTVKSFLSNDRKEPVRAVSQDQKLDRILFPERAVNRNSPDSEYCDRLVSDCSSADSNIYGDTRSHLTKTDCHCDRTMSLDNFVQILAAKVLEMSDMLVCLSIAAAASLFFIFGYYCFCNSSREGALLSKLNLLERSLLATHKENAILKHEIMETRGKLSSIQDNSFGSNDMVIALKKELEEEILEKYKLQEQVGNLEKELENATEAGLELNKIVSELLSNQTGDESIISSVEELQKQLNEQQNTIYEINTNLAEKSRENSELQLMLAEQNARFGGEIASLQQDNDELEAEKSNLQTRLDEIKNEYEEEITRALEGKNFEIRRLQLEVTDLNVKCEHEYMKWQTSLAKIEALEECLKTVKRDPSVNIKEVIDVANVRADLIDLQKQRASLKERLDAEKDTTKMLDDQVKALSAEVEKLKHEFHQSEKDKLEAQTRLEVLSNYFKEKEMQLQKELSIKEAMWLKQQGETTSTVDRLTSMQEEIQSLKSQNDSLRAEIEAQLAAHKAQIGTLENRAHETWLAARQSERRCEEARAEATSLRRKLTALVGGNQNEANRLPNAGGDGKLNSGELHNAPSPIHMESPGSPLLGRMPPPPFLPPPFLGPPPPFMGMPPPFMPPGEMRPPPLGRLMSPAPPSGGPPHLRSARYTPPDRGDYDDYDDDDDDLSPHRGRRRSIGGSDSWHRDSYSPPRTYRSHSPTDSRYNYTRDRDLISTYDTETDISPPPSPRERRQRGGRAASFKAYSPQPTASSPISEGGRNGRKASANKGALSSGSEKSYNSSSRHGNKAKEKGKGMV